jgi:hypothetical protein
MTVGVRATVDGSHARNSEASASAPVCRGDGNSQSGCTRWSVVPRSGVMRHKRVRAIPVNRAERREVAVVIPWVESIRERRLGTCTRGFQQRGAIADVGAFGIYGFVTLPWGTLGIQSTSFQSLTFGVSLEPSASSEAGCSHESRRASVPPAAARPRPGRPHHLPGDNGIRRQVRLRLRRCDRFTSTGCRRRESPAAGARRLGLDQLCPRDRPAHSRRHRGSRPGARKVR